MFGIFKKKAPRILAKDKVYISRDAKERAMTKLLQEDPSVIFIHWFEETYERSLAALGETSSQQLYMVREAQHASLPGKKIIFLEHYPLRSKEIETFERLNLQQPEVWSSLDEPLFKRFGGDRLVMLMQKLGMNESEAIEHAMISRSIEKAQEKIEKRAVIDHHAHSMESWFLQNARNIGGNH